MAGRSMAFRVAKHLPESWVSALLLAYPRLYQTSFIVYESYLPEYNPRISELVCSQTRNLEGNIIECGAARCGTSCFIGALLKKEGIEKKVFAMDSFGEGFDKSELEEEMGKGLATKASNESFTHNSLEYVRKKIKSLKLESYVIPVKGFFHETLSSVRGPFSLAIVDCDLEKSIEECLEYVWPRMSSGGVVLVDDYDSPIYMGARIATDRFIEKRKDQIHRIEHIGRMIEITS